MATIAAPHFAPLAQPDQAVRPRGELSAYRLIVTYVLLFPLLFFAVRGAFSFQYTSTNTSASGIYGALLNPDSGAGTKVHSAEMILCYALICLAMVPMWRQMTESCIENKLAFALPIWAMLSVFWSQEPKRTIVFAILALVHTMFAVYLSVRFKPRQQMQIFLLLGIVATLASIALVGAMPSAAIDHKNTMIGVEGIYPHKNICSMVTITLMMPAFFYRFKGRLGLLKKAVYLALTGALVLSTTARTGWLALAACLVFIFLAKSLRRVDRIKRLLVVLYIPGILLAVAWLGFTFRTEILSMMGKDATLSGRTIIWSAVFSSIFKSPWLGFGYDAFWIGFKGEAVHLALATGDPGLANAENGVLQVWLELGAVGVLILFALLLRACRNAIRCFRSDTPEYALWYMSFLFIALLSLVDGDKFMYPHAIAWTTLILADAGLAMQAKRVRAISTP